MRQQRNVVVLVGLAALVAGGLLASGDSRSRLPARADSLVSDTAEVPGAPPSSLPGRSGLRVHLDPQTGLLRARPAEADSAPPAAARDERFSSYGRDLIQERLPGGGYKVDLRGRFQSAVVATIDPETHEVTVDCVRHHGEAEAGDEQ